MKLLLTLLIVGTGLTAYPHGRHSHEDHFKRKQVLPVKEKKFGYPYLIQTLEMKENTAADNSQATLNDRADFHIRRARQTGELSEYKKAEVFARQSQTEMANVAARLILSEVAQADHHFQEALDWLTDLETDPTALSLKVRIYLGMGKIGEAETAAKRLVAMLPLMGSLAHLGTVYEAKRDYKKAMEVYYKALEMEDVQDPLPSAWVRSLMARLYYRNGQKTVAKKLLMEVKKIVPTYPMAKELSHGH